MPPIITQQVQPAFMQPMMQSQQDWIMAQHIASPLVQVTQHPLAVISHLHIAIVMLQQHTVMPFIVQHTEHMPPAIIAHRFCIMVHDAGSSHSHVIFIPPAHFSTFIMHRGTITMLGAMVAGIIPAVPVAWAAVIGFIIAVAMSVSVFGSRERSGLLGMITRGERGAIATGLVVVCLFGPIPGVRSPRSEHRSERGVGQKHRFFKCFSLP